MKQLPHNVDAEDSIFSAILIDNNVLPEIVDILSPDDFYRPINAMLWSAITELYHNSHPVDTVTLMEKLRESGNLEKIGGATHLAWLMDVVPLATNAPEYARIIQDKAGIRNMIQQLSKINTKCFAPGDADEIFDFAEQAVFGVTSGRYSSGFLPMSVLVDTAIEQIEARQSAKSSFSGVQTGYYQLDEMTAGLQPSDLIILAARPSMGKTSLALNIASNAALSGIPVGVFSLEMSKEQLSTRMLCSEARVNASKLRTGFLTREDWLKINEAAGIISDTPLYIDDTASISVSEIRAKSRRLKKDKDLGLIVIDYLQLMQGRASAERRDLEVGEITRSLKALAKELNVPVLCLSQLNRKVEDRADKRPLLADLRESGAIEQDADVVMFIYRDEVYNKDENNPKIGTAELIIGKQRNGPIGFIPLTFLSAYTRFENSYEGYNVSDT